MINLPTPKPKTDVSQKILSEIDPTFGDNLDHLKPLCGCGFTSCYAFTEYPSCFGSRLAGDYCCFSLS